MKTRLKKEYGGEKQVVMFKTEMLDEVGQMALTLIEKWGLVAAFPDGEDSAGRQKVRLPSEAELVNRALVVSEQFYYSARSRGHLNPIPDLNEINADYDKKEAEKEARARS